MTSAISAVPSDSKRFTLTPITPGTASSRAYTSLQERRLPEPARREREHAGRVLVVAVQRLREETSLTISTR